MNRTKSIIVFRADASIQIGTGHIMRSLTLADALSKTGAESHFICRAHEGNLAAFIRQRGYPVHLFDMASTPSIEKTSLAHAEWLGASVAQDAAETALLLSRLNPDWLIVDHYALDERWETKQRQYAKKIMVIDDLADRQHDCDLLLDQNLGRADADYVKLIPPHCIRLIGPNYALLRPEFARLRPYSLQRRQAGSIQKLLITMGGVDKDNATGRVLQALRHSSLPDDCIITVVMGETAPCLNEVKALAARLPWIVDVRVNVRDMAQLMADSDLAIGAAGSTAWERCCLGLPTLMVVLADNQQFIADQLAVIGAGLILNGQSELQGQLCLMLEEVISSGQLLDKLINGAASVLDGLGIEKIARHLRGCNEY